MQNSMLNAIHKGYISFLKEIKSCPEYERFALSVLRADKSSDITDTAMTGCEVEFNWIERIELALPYIDRAVRENRQFILREGETVPIEKVRRVSKTSVEHLARHSEYISREPENDEGVIPDKMFMAENRSTYAVYENRFLYMLLCYIKDFCEIRHAKIQALSEAFLSQTTYKKEISDKHKNISFSLTIKEEEKGNRQSEDESKISLALKRIRTIVSEIDTLLKTGLMVEVSASPMLKPPITRTNVLLQNPCFAVAIELYDYLCAYTGDGYTKKDIYRYSGAIRDEARPDYVTLVALASYLSHKHAGMAERLDAEYDRQAEAERQAVFAELELKLSDLKSRLCDIPDVAAEYILTLEDALKHEKEHSAKIEECISETAAAKAEAQASAQAQAQAQAELYEAKKELRRLEDIIRQNEQKLAHEMESASLRIKQKDEEAVKAVSNAKEKLEAECAKFKAEYKALAQEYHLKSAQLLAKDIKAGDAPKQECLSKEEFSQLEAEFEAFRKFYEAEWKKVKRQIRKSSLKETEKDKK